MFVLKSTKYAFLNKNDKIYKYIQNNILMFLTTDIMKHILISDGKLLDNQKKKKEI